MNLFTSIVRSVHKHKTQLRASCRRKRHDIVLSSERLEPRHYLSADGLVQDPVESWSVTYDGLTDGSQRPYTIGSGYSSSNLNQADVAMLADVVRARYDVTGKGIKIGIISDSFNALGGMNEDIALGVLPNMNETDSRGNPYIVSEAGYGEDEGRGMAQLVHAIAPGADLYFATPFEKIEELNPITPEEIFQFADEWAAGMKTQIETLVNDINVDIIVDDMYSPFQPWFQDGIVAQAVDWAVEGKDGKKGVAYFSAAGNDTNLSYQSTFRGTPYSEISSQLPSSVSGNTEQYLYHDFNPDEEVVDILQKVQFPRGYSQDPKELNSLIVQWDQPWDNNNSANEIWFFNDDEDRTFLGKN